MGKFDRFLDDLDNRVPADKADTPAAAAPVRVKNLPEGRWAAEGVYCTEYFYDTEEAYGNAALGRPEEMSVMRRFGASETLVFLDLETTGLSGGTGTYAFLCGIGRAEGSLFKVSQFFLEGPGREKSWLEAIDSVIPSGACLVTYNGKTFDLPLLRTRHILSRSVPVWDKFPHIDLLGHARRLYRGRLESCSLGSVERHVLGVRRTGEDIPGWQIPALYAEYLRTRDALRLRGVFYHNRLDILSLAAFYCRAAHILGGNTEEGLDLVRAGDFWASLGDGAGAAAFWERACEDAASRADAFTRRAFYAKRSCDFGRARCEFLQALSALNDPEGYCENPSATYTLLEEIAKLEEHRLGMPEMAMAHAEEALRWTLSRRWMLGQAFAPMHRSMHRRVERLRRKIDKKKGP